MSIEIQGINKHFDSFHALQDIDISIPTGGLVALLGPSGSGKSTLLRLIAGLENADSGQIYVDGKDFGEKRIQDRKVGFVFQHYALFKHMTIAENIAFGLKIRPRKERPSKKEINNRVEELLSLVQLSGLGDRFPSQLSGGQRQRIALARALAVEPEILLLDEPFGALDAKVRQELRQWLRELHDKLNITTIFVTHDQEEALEMADTVVVMDRGKVEQVGTPKEVYKSPETPFVYRFLGRVNAFPCNIENNRVKSGEVDLDIEVGNNVSYQEITGYIRPHEISVSKKITLTHSAFSKVCHVYYVGANIRMELNKVDSNDYFEVEMREEDYLKMGECTVGSHLFVNLNNMKLFLGDQQVVKRGKVLTASG